MARKSKNSFSVAGKVWATGREVAEHYGVKPNVFHMRINRLGWSVEEALGIKEREPKSRVPIEFKGKKYNSGKHFAEEFGLVYPTFKKRRRDGWTLDECLNPKLRKTKFNGRWNFIHNGRTYASLRDFASKHHLVYGNMVNNLKRGWSLDECLNPAMRPKRQFQTKPVSHNGTTYKSISEFAEKNGLSISLTKSRYYNGWTLDECLRPEIRENFRPAKKEIIFRGKTYDSLKTLAHRLGVHYGNLSRRLRSGWTLEEALEIKKRKRKPSSGKVIEIDGQVFPSLVAAAEHFGVSKNNIQNRLSLGWSPEEAVGIKPRTTKIPGNPKSVTFLGRKFRSYKERNEFYGLDEKTSNVERRISRGWTERQAVGLDPPPHRHRDLEGRPRPQSWKGVEVIEGQTYPKAGKGEYRLYKITNSVNRKIYIGITISTLKVRLAGHMTSALQKGAQSKLHRAIRKYGADVFRIELIRSDARNFRELGEQEIAAIKQYKSIKNGYNSAVGGDIGTVKPITVNGVTFHSRSAAAEYFGIEIGTFNLRLTRLRWSPEQAAGLQPAPGGPYKTPFEAGGKFYGSLYEACRKLGLDYKTIYARKRRGWTNEQAVGLAAPPNRKSPKSKK